MASAVTQPSQVGIPTGETDRANLVNDRDGTGCGCCNWFRKKLSLTRANHVNDRDGTGCGCCNCFRKEPRLTCSICGKKLRPKLKKSELSNPDAASTLRCQK